MMASAARRASPPPLAFGGPVWLAAALVLVWGAAVIPDSAQFSALVADAAPPDAAGSLLDAADRARLHPHLLHRAGGAAGRRRPSAGRRPSRSWRSGPRRHRGDAPADPARPRHRARGRDPAGLTSSATAPAIRVACRTKRIAIQKRGIGGRCGEFYTVRGSPRPVAP